MSSRKIHYVPSGDYSVRFAAYCGMSYRIGDDRQSYDDAIATVEQTIASRRRSGHPIMKTEGEHIWEIGEPDDCALVPDTAGILRIVPYLLRAVACWECDAIVVIGESCQDCEAAREDNNNNEDNNETETE